MAKFRYQAKDKDGKLLEGVIDSPDEEAALQSLTGKGLWVSSLSQQREQSLDTEISLSFFSGVSNETMSTFLLQLSIMIKCGISLAEALKSLEQGEENPKFRKILGQVHATVHGGQAFSEALAAHPDVFDKFLVTMVLVGETGGVLEEVLVKLSMASKRRIALRNQIIGALAYPSILFTVAGIVLLILMGFAVPRFADLFAKAGLELPITTRILIATSTFLESNLLQVAIGLLVSVITTIFLALTEQGRTFVGEMAFLLPILRPVAQRFFVVQISESMGLLLAAGVPLRELLLAIEGTVSLPTPKNVLMKMRESIDQGGSLKQALDGGPVFPAMAVKLIETGEVTGSLDAMFKEVSEYYDDQLQAAIRTALSMLEPILIAGMALVVGFIMLSIFVPLFQMSFIKPK